MGTVNELAAGSCFGERTLLGIASEANATVRVATPFALALAVAKAALQRALRKHPAEVEHFERLKTSPQSGRVSGSKVRHVELFRGCGRRGVSVLPRSWREIEGVLCPFCELKRL